MGITRGRINVFDFFYILEGHGGGKKGKFFLHFPEREMYFYIKCDICLKSKKSHNISISLTNTMLNTQFKKKDLLLSYYNIKALMRRRKPASYDNTKYSIIKA